MNHWDDDPHNRPPLWERFAEFHAANPQVYAELVKLARLAVSRGRTKLGIGQLFEVLRWNRMMSTVDPEGWKLNNDMRAPYARFIMDENEDLAGIFDLRRSQVDP